MCDCYGHECVMCKRVIPIHLGDFLTNRDEIEVFCQRHIPRDKTHGTLFMIADEDEDIRRQRVFIRYLTANARKRRVANHPNTWVDDVIKEYP